MPIVQLSGVWMRSSLRRLIVAAGLVLAAGPGALAADLPSRAQTHAAAAPAFTWTGCYAGALWGYQTGGKSSQTYGGLLNGAPNGFLPVGTDMAGTYGVTGAQAGGGAGCSYQNGNWVVGFEGDDSANVGRGRALAAPNAVALGLNPVFEFTTQQNWMATARGRIGYAVERWLFYVTGGAVFGGFELNNQNGLLVATATRAPSIVSKAGWVIGIGTEYAFQSPWSLKLEGLYVDYGRMHYGDEPGLVSGCTAGCVNADAIMRAYIIRLGLNLKII
jgi:outer membrane immunogenic protein